MKPENASWLSRSAGARMIAALLLTGLPGVAAAGGQEPAGQTIANWPAPAVWQPAQAAQTPAQPVEPGEARARRSAGHPESLAAVPTPSLTLIGITPCRIADTRDVTKPAGYGPPALSQGAPRNFTLTGQCGIAGTAQAVSLNITVTNTLGPGFISIYPQGGVAPIVSTLNYVAGQTLANAAVIPLGTGGGITVVAGVSGTDLIIDVNGYYDTPGVDTQGVTSNLLQIALLKWYPANRSTIFTVGAAPAAVAFDGASVWVTNNSDATVTKLRASDGACVTPCTFSGGASPYGIAFDGANIWVANQSTNKVTKLKASDGTNLGAFPVGSNPAGVAFDGANIWVANASSNNVTKLRASDGACVATCTFAVGTNPVLMAFDGTNIWVANYFSNSVTKLRASDGANLGAVPVGTNPVALAFDGANIWVVNSGANTVTKLRASDGVSLGTFPVSSVPGGIVFDGSNVWVSNTGSNTVTKLRASDGANLGTFNAGTVPSYMAFDGAHIWVTNFGGNTVTKL